MSIRMHNRLNYRLAQFAVLAILQGVAAEAATITVPDGDFSQGTVNVSVGGGLLATSGSSTIGSTPWTGTYNAVAGILVPPTLTISPSGNFAEINGLLSTGILLPILDNGGQFSQTLTGVNYLPNTTYSLTVDVDAASLLGAGISTLTNAGVGIGLTNGVSNLADTRTAALVNVSLLSNTNYQVTLNFTTGATAPTGNIGVRLFDLPNGVAQANLLGDVKFSNVGLSATATPEPGTAGLMLLGVGLCGLGLTKRRSASAEKSESLTA